ncbi:MULTISPECIES: glutathione S-transferase family protein [Roseobacteraceae]|jgi:glutathione S-transferase|uniref:Glutathione S-transferase GST-6.0 n=1 Tax=Pseudosulfitobacter pseudonitzschiae TaxID=1402135 RepID=A0A221K504_9RHOB|nr:MULTISPECIES: glutathione S-transferase family protein [Roseobacteraceae]ASM74076.1 glutathione S-transferase GST-6.0 [Pseudosulfitobacter pseudonitzschiae]
MLTLYHGANTRSSRIIQLLIEMDVLDRVDVRTVGLVRQGNVGAPDPANPHPEGKVPFLDHDGTLIRESNAIVQYLTDHFASPMGMQIGDARRGSYLSWLAYYGNVVEPVLIGLVAEIDHPVFHITFRGPQEIYTHLGETLSERPFLLGDDFTAADLIMVSPFQFMPDFAPDIPQVKEWIDRCLARPSVKAMKEYDANLMEAVG